MPCPRSPPAHWNAYRPSYNSPPPPVYLWPASLTALIGRTTRAYDVVINYTRDSEGGTRWSVEDIARVHYAGKQLHTVIRVLEAWESVDEQERDVAQIKDYGKDVRELCEVVLGVIGETERKTEGEVQAAERAKMYRRVRALEEEADMDVGDEDEKMGGDDDNYDSHRTPAPQSPDLYHEESTRQIYDTYNPSCSCSRQHVNRKHDVYQSSYNDKRSTRCRLRRQHDDLYRPDQESQVERLGNHVLQRPQARSGDYLYRPSQEGEVERLGNHVVKREAW